MILDPIDVRDGNRSIARNQTPRSNAHAACTHPHRPVRPPQDRGSRGLRLPRSGIAST